jgi:hypothetical protein
MGTSVCDIPKWIWILEGRCVCTLYTYTMYTYECKSTCTCIRQIHSGLMHFFLAYGAGLSDSESPKQRTANAITFRIYTKLNSTVRETCRMWSAAYFQTSLTIYKSNWNTFKSTTFGLMLGKKKTTKNLLSIKFGSYRFRSKSRPRWPL